MFEKIKTIIKRHLLNPSTEITPEMTMSDLSLDSFDIIEIIADIEEEFGVEISDREISKIKTLQDVLDYLNNR